jgi:hypothetical protein
VFFAWFVNPLLKSLPKGYLSRVLNSTRTALIKRQLTHRFDEEAEDCFETRFPGLALKCCRYCRLRSNLPDDMGAQPMAESAAKLRPFTRVSRAHRSEPFRSVRSRFRQPQTMNTRSGPRQRQAVPAWGHPNANAGSSSLIHRASHRSSRELRTTRGRCEPQTHL